MKDLTGRSDDASGRVPSPTRRRVIGAVLLGAVVLIARPKAAYAGNVVFECAADLRGV
jgi:hypothetical protein